MHCIPGITCMGGGGWLSNLALCCHNSPTSNLMKLGPLPILSVQCWRDCSAALSYIILFIHAFDSILGLHDKQLSDKLSITPKYLLLFYHLKKFLVTSKSKLIIHAWNDHHFCLDFQERFNMPPFPTEGGGKCQFQIKEKLSVHRLNKDFDRKHGRKKKQKNVDYQLII